MRIRPKHLDVARNGLVEQMLKGVKETRRGIRKRVGLQGGQRHSRYLVDMAPEDRLGQQHDVASRQKYRIVGRCYAGNVLARNAPMLPVNIPHWHFQNGEGLERGTADRV